MDNIHQLLKNAVQLLHRVVLNSFLIDLAMEINLHIAGIAKHARAIQQRCVCQILFMKMQRESILTSSKGLTHTRSLQMHLVQQFLQVGMFVVNWIISAQRTPKLFRLLQALVSKIGFTNVQKFVHHSLSFLCWTTKLNNAFVMKTVIARESGEDFLPFSGELQTRHQLRVNFSSSVQMLLARWTTKESNEPLGRGDFLWSLAKNGA